MRTAGTKLTVFREPSWRAFACAACLWLAAPLAQAGGVVTSMTEAALKLALAGGGTATFTNSGTISITSPISIVANTAISGVGFSVSLKGGGSNTLFHVVSNLTLISLTLTNGQATNGGALFITPSATVLATDCVFVGNRAVGNHGTAGAAGKDTSGIGGEGKNGGNGTEASGGAIFNQGQLVLLACQFLTNSAVAGNGGTGGAGGAGALGGGDGGRGGSGGSAYGGAVCSAGSLVVSNCTFAGNSATAGDGAAGGAAGAGGSVALAGNGGAGGRSSGAALCCRTNATVVNCTFVSNRSSGGDSAPGGQRANTNGSDGAAGGDAEGAGLWAAGTCALTNCTFSANEVTGGNGGAGGDGFLIGGDGGRGGYGTGGNVCNAGTMALINCTLVHGDALGGFGGLGGDGPMDGKTNGVPSPRGGNLANSTGTLLLKNSILAYPTSGTNSYTATNVVATVTNYTFELLVVGTNTFGLVNGVCGDTALPPQCFTNIVFTNGSTVSSNVFYLTNCAPPNLPTNCLTNIVFTNMVTSNYTETIWVTNVVGITNIEAGFNAYGVISDAGNNISSDASPAFGGNSWNNTDPKLADLANNGGLTKTIAPLVGSPALNAGDDAAAPPFDQRGAVRPSGAQSDIGAVELTVPTIQTQPASLVVTNGNTATFTVVATSDRALIYQWRFQGTNLPGATTSSYTRAAATAADAGDYFVMVGNALGVMASSNATLTVRVPPAFTLQPQSQAVVRGNSVTFTAAATGTAPLGYQWRFYGTNLPGATGTSFTRTSTQTADAGPYSVVVTNVAGAVTSTNAALTVNLPPAITTPPQSQTVNQGQPVTFVVTASGTAPLSYQWRLNGANLAGATTTQYRLSNAQTGHAGSYTVFVTNLFGSITSQVATLAVAVRPQLTQPALTGSDFSFIYSTRTGYQYYVESKDSLTNASWARLKTNPGTGGPITNHTSVSGVPSRFFRVVEE